MKFKIKLSSVALIPITFAVVSHCAQPQSNYCGVLPTVADTYYITKTYANPNCPSIHFNI